MLLWKLVVHTSTTSWLLTVNSIVWLGYYNFVLKVLLDDAISKGLDKFTEYFIIFV